MTEVGIGEAKTNLSRLVDAALDGDQVAITRRGEPVVRLVAVRGKQRSFAELRGTVPNLKIADDFDELPEDMARTFGVID